MTSRSIIPGISLDDCQELFDIGQRVLMAYEKATDTRVPDYVVGQSA